MYWDRSDAASGIAPALPRRLCPARSSLRTRRAGAAEPPHRPCAFAWGASDPRRRPLSSKRRHPNTTTALGLVRPGRGEWSSPTPDRYGRGVRSVARRRPRASCRTPRRTGRRRPAGGACTPGCRPARRRTPRAGSRAGRSAPGRAPAERGEEPGPEGVADAGRLDLRRSRGRPATTIGSSPLRSMRTPSAPRVTTQVPTRSSTSSARPAGLLGDQGGLVLVGEQDRRRRR